MTTPYCSKDEWAYKKGYANWAAYDKSYPTATDLDDYLDEMTDIMNGDQYLNVTSNITTTRYVSILRRICYLGVNYMMQEEEAMAQERTRTVRPFVDYMRPSHRQLLRQIGARQGTRVYGGVS